MSLAFLFPGQGAQYVGMGKDFYLNFASSREVFEMADDILKENLSELIFEGPQELLTETRNAQPALFVTSMAILKTLQKERPDLKPSVCAGLSLGEFTALCASNRLGFKETLLLVRERARLMSEACERTSGTMAAVLGLDHVEEVLLGLDGVWVANLNAPGQTVISGTQEGIEKAAVILKNSGARRVVPLTVHGAFHSPLMQSAQEGLAPWIQGAPIQDNETCFVMNVPGSYVKSISEIRSNLICQVTSPCLWKQGIDAMKAAGVQTFLEIGCGKTLSGLNKKMGISQCFFMDQIADLELAHAIT